MLKLPLKMRIMQLAKQAGPLSPNDVLEMLRDEYAGERQINLKEIKDHMAVMGAVGILHAEQMFMDEQQNYLATYSITKTGERYFRYIPCN